MSIDVLIIDNDILHIRFPSGFNYAVFVDAWSNADYLSQLHQFRKVIWDYSLVQPDTITEAEILDFTKVARIQSEIYGALTVAIVVVNDISRQKAIKFVNELQDTPWHYKIFPSLNAAINYFSTVRPSSTSTLQD